MRVGVRVLELNYLILSTQEILNGVGNIEAHGHKYLKLKKTKAFTLIRFELYGLNKYMCELHEFN